MREFSRHGESNNQFEDKIGAIMKARVEYTADPLKLGRVRVRIPTIHGTSAEDEDFVKSEDLPWASPCTPFASSGEDFGSFIVPHQGSMVWIMYEDGDSQKPVYIGGSFGSGSTRTMNDYTGDSSLDMGGAWKGSGKLETPEDIYQGSSGNNPHRGVLFKSPKGHTIVYDDTDGQESLSLFDRIGQCLKFKSPVTSSANQGNGSRRGLADAEKGSALGTGQLVDGTSEISLWDRMRQFFKMKSTSNTSSIEIVSQTGQMSGLKLETGPDGTFKLWSDGVVIEGKSGSGNLTLSTGGSTIVATPNSISLDSNDVSVNGSSISISGGSVNISGSVSCPGHYNQCPGC